MRNLAERLRAHYVEGVTLQAILTAQNVNVEITPSGLQGLMALLGASQDKGFARAKREVNGTPRRSYNRRSAKRHSWPVLTPKLRAKRAKGSREVMEGRRPRIKDAVALVMKPGVDINITDVVSLLKKRKWLPITVNPQNYVCRVLTTNEGAFQRTSNGVYRLRPDFKPEPFTGKPRTPGKPNGIARSLPGLRTIILSRIPDEPNHIRGSAIAERSGRTYDSVQAMLKSLEQKGVVKMSRHKGHIVWSKLRDNAR